MSFVTGSPTSYVSTSQTTSTASIAQPIGYAAGDIICIFGFAHDSSASYIIADAGDGFTAGGSGLWSGASQGPASTVSWIWKVAASEPANYTVTVGANFDIRILSCACWRGRSATPVNINVNTNGAGTISPVTYALTGGTASASDDGIWVASAGSGNAVWTPPSGFTAGANVNSNGTAGMNLYFAYQNAMSAGATGTITGTETGVGTDLNGFVISLAAGSVGVPIAWIT